MPKSPRPPDPVPEWRRSESEAEALELFRNNVTDAATIFLSDPDKGQRAAVEATLRFVWDISDHAHMRAPFVALAKRLDSRPRNADPVSVGELKGMIAAALNVLMVLGEKEEIAARDISRVVDKLKIRIGSSDPEKSTWEAVVQLRQTYLRRQANSKAVEIFDYRRGEHVSLLTSLLTLQEDRRKAVIGLLELELAKKKPELPRCWRNEG